MIKMKIKLFTYEKQSLGIHKGNRVNKLRFLNHIYSKEQLDTITIKTTSF